jgi:hypothetical protein
MEKEIYHLQIQGTKVVSLSKEKQSETDMVVEVDSVEYDELSNNLDFMFVNGDEVFLDEVLKEKTLKAIASRDKIQELKLELTQDDYKVIKCYEAQLVGKPMPYNISDLVKKREAIRNEINALEKEIE